MDEPQRFLGVNHRMERHVDNEAYREFIRKRWGDRAIVEWLFHIAMDNLVTAYKTSNDVYQTAYNYYRLALLENGKIVIDYCKLSEDEVIRRFRDKTD